MSERQESDAAQGDDDTRERSSHQRNIPVPTPPDVRAQDHQDDDLSQEGDQEDTGP